MGAGAAALAAVILSPLAMDALGGSDALWGRLSQIGAAYGFASALVAALALSGVAVSLLQGNRQAKADQIQAIRSYYLELAQMQLDDMASYEPCWGYLDFQDELAKKRHIYCDLMMNYAWMGYQVGSIPDGLLRDMFESMFSAQPGYEYWRRARSAWAEGGVEGRAGSRFMAIVDDVHSRAQINAPSSQPPQSAAAPPERPMRRGQAYAAVLGVAVAVTAVSAARRRRR